MNAGIRIPSFIEELTRISTAMVRKAPPADKVMREVFDFVGNHPLVVHNASFACKFWDAELARVQLKRRQEFACFMLVARRLLPQTPSHKLGALVEFAKLPAAGRAHRALDDVEMAASLATHLDEARHGRYNIRGVSHELLRKIQKVPKSHLDQCLERYQRNRRTAQ